MFILWTCVWLLPPWSSGHVRVYAPRKSQLCFPISAGLKAASIMHEDQYAVALWVRPCNSAPISSIPANCPGRLKRSMPWIYQGAQGGRHTTFQIPKLFLFFKKKKKKKEGNKASSAVLLTFAVLGQDLMTTFREKFSQRSVLKRLFSPSLPVTDCPLRDFAAVFIVLREYLSGCCAVCSCSVQQIMIITSPQVSAKELQKNKRWVHVVWDSVSHTHTPKAVGLHPLPWCSDSFFYCT